VCGGACVVPKQNAVVGMEEGEGGGAHDFGQRHTPQKGCDGEVTTGRDLIQDEDEMDKSTGAQEKKKGGLAGTTASSTDWPRPFFHAMLL